ncbi:hypothetical protein DUI87_22165 [Hirundo rustica rustica]|uniref:Uncharacterized protein n=1 Tax=Hirundo rustica rustica TaxID=333673 RepID=A0A3M0JJP9_HIRRU|nr:hypothetical protein DUI87_22165 [Hirundo rustica rustica]
MESGQASGQIPQKGTAAGPARCTCLSLAKGKKKKDLAIGNQRVLYGITEPIFGSCAPETKGKPKFERKEGFFSFLSGSPCPGWKESPGAQHRKELELLEPGQRRLQDEQRDGAALLGGKAARAGIVQPGQEKLWEHKPIKFSELSGTLQSKINKVLGLSMRNFKANAYIGFISQECKNINEGMIRIFLKTLE